MAIDITISHYTDGTATVAGVNVTGQGTTWSLLRPGDQYGTHRGFGVRIAEVIDDSHLTLAYDVPALYQTEAEYEIQRTPYELGYMQGIQDLLLKLGNGNLDSFAGLNGLADKLPMFTGPGELALVSKIDLVSGVNFNVQVDDLAGRAAYDNEATGFAVLVANVGNGRSAIYAKRSGGAADWSDAAYLTGPAITLDVTEVDEVPYGTPPDVTLTPIAGGYNLAFEIPRGMLIEPGTTTTLPPGSPASVDFVPVTGGYRLDISLPKGDTGDIDGVTPFWVSRLSTDADAEDALTGLGVTPFWQGRITADANAGAALTGLGFSDFIKMLVDDADAAAARTTLGAQAALGYTPANRAGDTFTGVLLLDDSTSTSAPVLAFDGDSDTGLSHPAANTVSISTNGVERWRNTDGNLSATLPGGSTRYPVGLCRAWAQWTGTGTVTLNGSLNVSSITDLGVGLYRANFATAMPDAFFAATASAENTSLFASLLCSSYNATTGSISVCVAKDKDTFEDGRMISVAVFR